MLLNKSYKNVDINPIAINKAQLSFIRPPVSTEHVPTRSPVWRTHISQNKAVSLLLPGTFLFEHNMQSLCFPSAYGIITCSFPCSLCSLSDGERHPVCRCTTTLTADLTHRCPTILTTDLVSKAICHDLHNRRLVIICYKIHFMVSIKSFMFRHQSAILREF